MPEDKTIKIKTIKQLRVVNDPYRMQILSILSEAEAPTTAKEVADMMNESPSKINYHMGILSEYDFIEIDHTENINGIIAKFYKMKTNKIALEMEGNYGKMEEMKAINKLMKTTFDMARDEYVEQLSKIDIKSPDIKDNDSPYIFSKKMYLNDDEKKEIIQLFEKFSLNSKQDRKKYSLFISFIDKS